MAKALGVAAAAEAGTGLALLVVPALVVRLLFGTTLPDVGVFLSRFAGIALIGLGAACWPGANAPRRGMLLYGALAAIYLGYLGVSRALAGPLLWPAVAVHAVLCLALARKPAAGGTVAG